MTNHEELGLTIRSARLEKSMSLGQLASAVGRSSSSVRRWERGEVAPAASVLPKLAAILEIDPKLLEEQASSDSVAPTSTTGNDGRVSTVEQPAVGVSGTSDPASQVAVAAPSSRSGFLSGSWSSLTNGDRGWMAWARGLLTVAVLIAMLFVLVWALGELFDALGAVLDSFDVGSNGGEEP
jgi:transcriptional regulator with XRE-family HTH domain